MRRMSPLQLRTLQIQQSTSPLNSGSFVQCRDDIFNKRLSFSLATNGLALGEEADFEAQSFV